MNGTDNSKGHFYKETSEDLTGQVIHRVNLHVHNMVQMGHHITERMCHYLTTDIDRTQLYMLIDIDK